MDTLRHELSGATVTGIAACDHATGDGSCLFRANPSLQIPTETIHYGMTKTAQLAVARGLAETLVGTGVTVNSVLPGPTASEGVAGFVAQMAADRGVDAATVERSPIRGNSPPQSSTRGRVTPCAANGLTPQLTAQRRPGRQGWIPGRLSFLTPD